jgi:hypothetical protein
MSARIAPEIRSGLSSFCQKGPGSFVLTTWARLRFTKGSNDARPDRRTTSFGYCIRTQKGAELRAAEEKAREFEAEANYSPARKFHNGTLGVLPCKHELTGDSEE